MTLEGLPLGRDVPTVPAAQMAEADRIASTDLGIPLEALMENAARQIAAATRALLGETEGQLVAAVVGTGNNGGDALAALRHLQGWGAVVDAFVAGPPERLRPLARRQYDILARLGVPLYDTTVHDDGFLVHRLRGRHALLDGLLGYSGSGAPRGEVQRLIRLTNAAAGPPPVVAVDLPSGLDPDTGSAPGEAIRATVTVTLALPKPGLVAPAARELVGELVLADIGIPAQAFAPFGIDAHLAFVDGDLVRIIR
jgi:hydroxyethylthiazole kinase-like uncharacterized protein yjeF